MTDGTSSKVMVDLRVLEQAIFAAREAIDEKLTYVPDGPVDTLVHKTMLEQRRYRHVVLVEVWEMLTGGTWPGQGSQPEHDDDEIYVKGHPLTRATKEGLGQSAATGLARIARRRELQEQRDRNS